MQFIKYYGGCLPSLLRGFPNGHCTIQHVVDGRRRLGHMFTYGASQWHHQGFTRDHMTQAEMTEHFGPSLALNPRQYHDEFGSEQQLVALQNRVIEVFHDDPWPEFDMPMKVANDLCRWHAEQRS